MIGMRWLPVLIGLLLSPPFGMMALGRGRRALTYAGLFGLFLIACPIIFSGPTDATLFHTTAGLTLGVWFAAGLYDCYRFAHAQLSGDERPVYARWFAWLPVALVTWTAWLQYGWEPYEIASESMLPYAQKGDIIIVFRSWPTALRPGDLIVFEPSKRPETPFLARLVGLPGDEVKIDRGKLAVNGNPVTGPMDSLDEAKIRLVERLPNGRAYTVLLDPKSDLYGEQTHLVPKGHLFVLGDNRSASVDSRDQNFIGYVPMENVIGRASRGIVGDGNPGA